MRVFVFLLVVFAAFGACTPEAIEVDPPGSAGAAGEEPSGTGAAQSAGASGGTGGGEGGTISSSSAGAPDNGGSSGAMPMAGRGGSGGAMPSGGSGGKANGCAPLSSPNPKCNECMPVQCAASATACAGTACTCGNYAGHQGQMNCLLACTTLSPMMDAASACASKCGFNFQTADPTTRALFDCLVNPPMGPPLCPDCFPVH